MKRVILCDLDTAENNYDYDCKRLYDSGFNDYDGPCVGCSHRCHKEIEIPDTEEKQ